ncbi:MAG TPA: OsmC family peroxiredoxin [Dehalococcoidia bacterium]|nr:OsmC family peroxiredoxin [Dehalococcoidia bacterium]
MPIVMESRARATWEGNVREGAGRVTVESGAFPEQTVTLGHRTEDQQGHTTPEELIAAAHAVCYSMALSGALTKNGTPPGTLEVSAVCSLDKTDTGLKIAAMDLTVRGKIDGLESGQFEEIARQAEQACPVSNALRGNVDIRLKVEAPAAG